MFGVPRVLRVLSFEFRVSSSVSEAVFWSHLPEDIQLRTFVEPGKDGKYLNPRISGFS
jgi:hypothetical protein